MLLFSSWVATVVSVITSDMRRQKPLHLTAEVTYDYYFLTINRGFRFRIL